MRPIKPVFAAIFASGVALAWGQAQPPEPARTLSDANAPTTQPDVASDAAVRAGRNDHPVPRMNFVDEPIASASKEDDGAKAIVEALNADASLKDSKITVQPMDDGAILLTGSSMTRAQAKRAGEVAAGKAGEGKVVNVIRDSEAYVMEAPAPAA